MPTSPLPARHSAARVKAFCRTLGFLTAQAAAVCVVAPLIEGDDLHAGGNVSIGRVLPAVGHGVTQGVQGERGVLWNLHRSLCRLGGRRRLILDHHRRGDRIAVAVVLIDDDGLQEEGDALAFLMVARLHHLGEPRAVLVDDMHRGIDGPKQRPMPAHAFLAVDRLMVRQGDVDADGRLNAADIGNQGAHVLGRVFVAAAQRAAHGVDDDETNFATMAPRQVLERGDDVGGNLRVAEVERPADHLERQLLA